MIMSYFRFLTTPKNDIMTNKNDRVSDTHCIRFFKINAKHNN